MGYYITFEGQESKGVKFKNIKKFNKEAERQNWNIAISDEFMSALQYQDILAQQLSATIETIDISTSQIKDYMANFDCDDIGFDSVKFQNITKTIANALKIAKVKQEAFGGKKLNNSAVDEIDFF
jgi:hypothetical protein